MLPTLHPTNFGFSKCAAKKLSMLFTGLGLLKMLLIKKKRNFGAQLLGLAKYIHYMITNEVNFCCLSKNIKTVL